MASVDNKTLHSLTAFGGTPYVSLFKALKSPAAKTHLSTVQTSTCQETWPQPPSALGTSQEAHGPTSRFYQRPCGAAHFLSLRSRGDGRGLCSPLTAELPHSGAPWELATTSPPLG